MAFMNENMCRLQASFHIQFKYASIMLHVLTKASYFFVWGEQKLETSSLYTNV